MTKHEIAFLTPAEVAKPLTISIGLSGGSGSGKTYSALLLASGMADAMTGQPGAPFAMIDTENRRGLHYRDNFPQMLGHYVALGATDAAGQMVGYPPDRWIAMLDKIKAAGVSVVVVDSFSHAWEGIGGVLEMQAKTLERLANGDEKKAERMTPLSWAMVKPDYRKLINEVIGSPVHVILCTRAKPVMQKWDKTKNRMVNAFDTKTRSELIPWDIASDRDLMFEMTAQVILDHIHPGCPKYQVKVADQFRSLFRTDEPLTAATGAAMVEWSRGRGTAQEEKAMLDAARAAARQGKDVLQAHYKALSPAHKAIVSTILDEIRQTAIDADARPPADDLGFPTPEEMAAAAAADEEAIRLRDEAAERGDANG